MERKLGIVCGHHVTAVGTETARQMSASANKD